MLRSARPDQSISYHFYWLSLNLPVGLFVDLIVCAQAFHTFSSKVTGDPEIEERARLIWRSVLPDDKSGISIWYYNLDPRLPLARELDSLLKSTSPRYSESKTPLLDACLFEPKEFLYYIDANHMAVSKESFVDRVTLKKSQLGDWLKSYPFGPASPAEE